ncbi:anti-sigma factor family protein [Lacipirellula sp.]|uniref:anti-sigma factor family protein n=1 Tax=Lacipirellula sp. TaxID=2691419 RepID=UPI003D0C4B97
MTAQGNNDDEFDDELLSAYVDGELTAAERARVEERLRNDPLAAALVDELRSLSNEIQRLPREPLGLDLRASVLAEIDQARADLATHGPATLPEPPIDRWAGIRRGLVWSALAIAATVVIAIFQPPEEKHAGENVAKAKKAPVMATPPQEEAEQLSRENVAELRRADQSDKSLLAEQSHEPLAADKQKADEVPPGFRAQLSAAPPAPPAGEPTTLGFDAAAAPATVAPAAPMSEAASAPADALATESSGAGGARALEFKEASPAADAALAAAEPMSDAPAERFGMAGGAGGGGMPSLGKKAEEVVATDESQRAALKALKASETEGATTVTLELAKPEGAEWFRELLAKSDIAAATPSQSEGGELGRPLARGMQARGGAVAAHDKAEPADAVSRQLTNDGAFDNEADRSELADSKTEAKNGAPGDRFYFYSQMSPALGVELRSRSGGDQQMVWVEASSQKIEQLLAACRATGAMVSAVSVDGAAAVDATAPQQTGKPQAGVAGAGQTAEAAAPFGGLAASSSAAPAEAASADARVRVLFVLQSPLVEASPVAPAALPTIAPPATGEAR